MTAVESINRLISGKLPVTRLITGRFEAALAAEVTIVAKPAMYADVSP